MKTNMGYDRINPPTAKTAAIYSGVIIILMHLLLLVMFVYGRSAVLPLEDERPARIPMTTWMFLCGMATTYVYVFILFCINFHVLKKERLSNRGKAMFAIVVSLVFILLWNRIMMALQGVIFDIPKPDFRMVRGSIMRDLVTGGIAVFSSQIVYLTYRRNVITLENQALKAEYERARYEALKNQIDPHFLFNTLNTLNSIIGSDPPTARKYVQKLSSIFRYTIRDGGGATTLGEEIEFTKDYCDLMRIRYGENLDFVFDIAGKYNIYQVLPFSIQTLVENAIKHNVITDRHPLTVTVATDADDSVTVSNRVNVKKEQEPGEGIGLSNLSERYRLKWREDIVIRNDGDTFSVRLPLIRNLTVTEG